MSKKKNMELWNRLCHTNPVYTKSVNQRGGFTAIGSHSQVMAATEEWGPCGGRWGFSFTWIPDPDLWVAEVTLRYPGPDGECIVTQMGAAARLMGSKVDSDAPKKSATDGLTKCLSYTGMNADVFLGLFDDNKYVAEMREKFKPESNGANPEPANLAKAKADFSAVVGRLRREVQSTLTDNKFIHTVISDFSHGPVLTTIGAVNAVRKAVEEGRYDLATGKRADTDTNGKPNNDAPPSEPGHDYMTEISGLAKVRYGADWFDHLNAECKEHGINLGKMNDGEAIKLIGLLSGQLEGAK